MKKYNVVIEKKVDREGIVDFLSKTYGPNYFDARRVFNTIFDHEPSLSPRNLILARSDRGDLIGVVRIVDRKILVDGVILECGGISSVGVHSQWREKGVCTALMDKAIETMIARGKDVSILHGRRAMDGFYVQYGYTGIGRYTDMEVDYPDGEFKLKAAPFQQNDFNLIKKMYDKIYRHLTGSFVRDAGVWNYLLALAKNGNGRIKIFVYKKGKESVGYFVIIDRKMVEMAVEKEHFLAVSAINRSLGVDSVALHPRHPFYIFCRTHLNTTAKERFALDGGYMARIINVQSLLKKLGPALAVKARALGAGGQVLKLLNHAINLKNGKVYNTNKINDIIFTKKAIIIRFLLRVVDPSDIEGIVWDKQKPWIPFLFKGSYYHTNAWDEV